MASNDNGNSGFTLGGYTGGAPTGYPPTGPGAPSGGGSPLPLSSGDPSDPFAEDAPTPGDQASNPDAGSIWSTIIGLGEDIGKAVIAILPKNKDGSINWSAVTGDVFKGALTTASAVGQYQRQQQSNTYANEALNGIKGTPFTGAIGNYAANQPLRDAGRAGMLAPGSRTPNLTPLQNLAGANSGNPFANALPLAAPKPVAPMSSGSSAAPLGAPTPLPNLPLGPIAVNPSLPSNPSPPGQPSLPPGAANGVTQGGTTPPPGGSLPPIVPALNGTATPPGTPPGTPPMPPVPGRPLPLAPPAAQTMQAPMYRPSLPGMPPQPLPLASY